MRRLIVFAVVGLVAQLVDGALGMAYGVTSSSLMLAVGLAPAAASASVHLSEIGTTLVSGASHWRFGNVDWRVVRRLGVPGAIGAFAGATLLVQPVHRGGHPVDGRHPPRPRPLRARPLHPRAHPDRRGRPAAAVARSSPRWA